LGISAQQIAKSIGSTYSSDSAISNFEQNGRQFDITLRASDEYRSVIDDLKKMQIQTQTGEMVMLDGLITLETTEGAASINRFDRERKILVTANLDGAPLDTLVNKIDSALPSILGEGYHYRYTGDIERMQRRWKRLVYRIAGSCFDLSDSCGAL
jgi:HAE1 family hydrophobic/amphiphilic exporter-1